MSSAGSTGEETAERRRHARLRLEQRRAAVRLCPHQESWGDPQFAKVGKMAEGAPEGARHFTFTFPVPNTRKFADLVAGQHEDFPSFVAMLYGIAQGCNLGVHGITPKRVKQMKHMIESLNLDLTDKDCAVTVYHEIISLPRVLLKPGEMCRTAPNDAYLRVWVFALPHEGGVTDEVNCEALDLAVKINVIWAAIAQQKMKGVSKKGKQKFDAANQPQFALDKMTSMHKWIQVAKHCVDLPASARGVVPTAKNMGIYHPELLLGMSSPVFQTPLPERTGLNENVRRARLDIQRQRQNPTNYQTGGAQLRFVPHNPDDFHAMDNTGLSTMNQVWQMEVSGRQTPNREKDTNPAMLVATPCWAKLQARSQHEPRLRELARHPLFAFGDKPQAHFHTTNEEWLLLRTGAEVDKRQCCGLAAGNSRKLFDCLHDHAPETLLPGDGPRNVLNRRCTFQCCETKDAFLRAVQAWGGDPLAGEGVPLHIMQMNPSGGNMEPFVHPDYVGDDDMMDDDDDDRAGETAPAVVALLPHHMDWSNRDILEWTLKVLSRSNFSPKPAFLVDTLQGGKSRGTVMAEYDKQRRRRRKKNKKRGGKRRKKVPAPRTLPLSADAAQVAFAMHFALPDVADPAARDRSLVEYCLPPSPAGGAADGAADRAADGDRRDRRLPVFFERLPTQYKMPRIAEEQYVCGEARFDLRPSFRASQDVFVEQVVDTQTSSYSVGPDHTRAEPQTTTLARIAFDELVAQYGPETAMLKAGENYAVHVVNNTQKNFHTEEMMQWFFKNMERKEDGDWVAKKTTEFPQICLGDPDFYVEDALEAAKQQWFVEKGMYRNHFLAHLLWVNFLTAFVEIESNEMGNENPGGAVAIVARPGWGKSFVGALLMSLFGPQHFAQAANKSKAAGQGVSRDTGEKRIIWNDEFAFYMTEEENGACPLLPRLAHAFTHTHTFTP